MHRCLVRLPTAVGEDPRHFNLVLAKDDLFSRSASNSGADWLVIQLGQLVALAYQVMFIYHLSSILDCIYICMDLVFYSPKSYILLYMHTFDLEDHCPVNYVDMWQ